MGRQNTNALYLQVLASAYACRAGFAEPTFFSSNLAKTPSPLPVGGMTTYTTSSSMDAPDNDEFDDLDPDTEEAPRYDGIVRAIKGTYLVSKKEQPDETYTEVWVYNVGDEFEDEANIRKSILSATDIDPTKNFSEDGSQEAVMKTVGNVQFLTLSGLPD